MLSRLVGIHEKSERRQLMDKKERKRLTVVLCCLFVLTITAVPFLCVFFIGICLPPQYSLTYYGELAEMYHKLKTTDGKKVVVLGNSNVAFGVDSALAEKLLKEAGLDYAVCNFGLYGALGTKMMCELAGSQLHDGDIVIFTPELVPQSLSSYFSAEEAWRALDSDMGLYCKFSSETKHSLTGAYFGYVSKKLSLYQSGEAARGSGVYARSSFDENCDLKNYPRPYNVMPGGSDINNPIAFESSFISEDFISYINGFADQVNRKGAQIFYSFAPMNASAVSFSEMQKAGSFYEHLDNALGFRIISNIKDYIMESEWFYDSNYHLNESGMTVRTVQLVNDIKNELGNSTKTGCVLPAKPMIPDEDVEGEGDNSNADLFEYRLDGSYYTVVGLTEAGKAASELIIPCQVNGIYVKAFLPLVFFDNKNIKSVTVQENIHTLSDGSFLGCDNLTSIILKHAEPADIAVGYRLLEGAGNCVIYVPEGSLSQFKNNYFWSKYARQLQGY